MCGICGIWYFDSQRRVEPELLRCMTNQIIHRGPDEEGHQNIGSLGMGFRRLSIIDIHGSQQPMANEEQSIWLSFNGEIYNYQSLRQLLLSRYNFLTNGDTETIIHAYREYGFECLQEFRGMYSFIIYDHEEDLLFAAVDRFGKKPFYYYYDEEKFIYGSEIKTILQYPDIDLTLDRVALDEYLTYGYVSAPRTIFKNISKLPPAHFLHVRRGSKPQLQEYWHPTLHSPEHHDNRSLDELAEELLHHLTEAVKFRMISDVPLGAFLSGGMDSSAIVALMCKVSNTTVNTFSIGFEDESVDETHYAQMVADMYQTNHSREEVKTDVSAILPKLIHQYDEPFADSSMVPTYYVSEAARKHVTVALSGDGGDEVFGGYYGYRYGYRHQFLQSLIPQSFRPLAEQVGRVLPRFTKVKPYLEVVNQPIQYWMLRNNFFNPAMREELYTENALHRRTILSEDIKREKLDTVTHLDWLSQFQHNDLTIYMPSDILVKVDRASMLASLEVRSPLLDHVLFEFMAKVPPRYKMDQQNSKILLKHAMKDLLPDEIFTRKKQGFIVPLAEWLRNPLRGLMQDTLLDQTTRERGLWNVDVVKRYIDEHLSHRADHKHRLWSLLCFELWAREYVDSPAEAPV